MSKKDIFMKEYLPYIIVIIIVLLIKAFIVTPIRVNGPSMLDTLEDKDIMILDEVSFKCKGLKRFDIVVVNYKNEKIIKRVVGLPGETVEYKDNKLYINGEEVEEDFFFFFTANVDAIKIPGNLYYVMGVNSVNLIDSRIIGPVSIKNIKGTTKLTVFPFKRFGNKK